MAKGNLFLGFGRGKVGDVVMYRANGEQVTRARNRSPKNPQTALQLLQRSIMHTSSAAYSQLSKICDHSFQGFQTGTENQSRFTKLNVAMLRNRCADEINSGDAAVIMSSRKYNYMAKNDAGCVVNPYVISEGSLPTMGATMATQDSYLNPLNKSLPVANPSYSQVIEYLGAQRGDQLTFVWMLADAQAASGHDPFVTGFRFSRVILEPSDSDLSHAFVSPNGVPQTPNAKNEGYVIFQVVDVTPAGSETAIKTLAFNLIPATSMADRYSPVGCAVILSRRLGDSWERSSESFSLINTESISNQLDGAYLGDAVMSYLSEINSSLYLNQAKEL